MNKTLFSELNPSQLEATINDISTCTKIVAGAGCGKTKVISSRYLKLVLDMLDKNIKDPLDKILVITFTDKAANEMKERIQTTLKKAGIEFLGKKIWISTFHKFAAEILKKHSIEVSLNPDYQLIDEIQENKIFSQVKTKIMNLDISKIDNFNQICENLDLPLDILSTNTFKELIPIDNVEVLLDEIYPMIKQIKAKGLTPKEFLVNTIKATKNFTKKVLELNNEQYTKEDYISSWSNILENYTDNNADFSALLDHGIIINKNRSKNAAQWTISPDFNKLIEQENKEILYTQIVGLIYAIFQFELLQNALIDFDDLINKTLEIFKSKPNILDKYKSQFKHIIIDEFQDTNGAQLELVKLLLNDDCAGITFVGDRKQSIYGFRYAQSENLEVLHKFIEKKYHKEYPEVSLNLNYRSAPKILEKVNTLVNQYLKLNEKLISGKNYDNNYGNVTKKIIEASSMAEIKYLQGKYIAERILEIKNKSNFKFSDFAILVNSHTEADFIEEILAKYNIASNKKVNKSFFQSKNIKNLKALLNLYNNQLDEIALVRLLYLKLSEAEIYKLKKELENAFVNSSDEKTKYMNFAEKFFSDETKYIVNNFHTFTSQIRKIFKHVNRFKPTYDVFLELVSLINLINYETDWENFKAQLEIKTFEKIILDWQKEKKYAPTMEFLKYLEEISENKDFELPKVILNEDSAVNIMTVHASKGLEFKNIFVTYNVSKAKKSSNRNFIFDLSWGNKTPFGMILSKLNDKDTIKRYIYKNIWEKPRNEAENLRLFYVAITRAEENLDIISFQPYSTVKPLEYHNIFD